MMAGGIDEECKGIGTKSCLAPFRLGGNNSNNNNSKRSRSRGKGRSRFAQMLSSEPSVSDKLSLLERAESTGFSASTTEAWSREADPVTTPLRGRFMQPAVTPSPPRSKKADDNFDDMPPTPKTPEDLLAMPKPRDRSHRARLIQEREGKGARKSVYDGEAEPAGYRGQEATPEKASQVGMAPHLQLDLRSGSPAFKKGSPDRVPSIRNFTQPDDKGSSPSKLMTIVSDDHSTSATSASKSPERPPAVHSSTAEFSFSTIGATSTVGATMMEEHTLDESDIFHDIVPKQETGEPRWRNDGFSMGSSNSSKSSAPIKERAPPTAEKERDAQTWKHETNGRSGTTFSGRSSPVRVARKSVPSKDPRKAMTKSPSRAQSARQSSLGMMQKAALTSSSPTRKSKPDDESSTSTKSDEDLQEMITDFLTSKSPIGKDSQTGSDKSVVTASTVSTGSSSRVPDVNAMNDAAKEHVSHGEYDLALVLFGQILSIYKKKHGVAHPLVASAYHNLGMVHSQRATQATEGSLEQRHVRQQSLECFQAAARTARDSLGKNHLNVAVSLVRIGFLLLQARQYDNAVVTFQEALRIRLVHFGHNPHPLVANLYNNLGVCHMHLKNFDEGERFLQRALDIQRHILRVERLDCTRDELRSRLLEVADTLCNLGGIHLESLEQGYSQRHIDNAKVSFTEALEIRSTVLGNDNPLVSQCRELLEKLHEAARPKPKGSAPNSKPPPRNSPRNPASPETANSSSELSAIRPPLPPIQETPSARKMPSARENRTKHRQMSRNAEVSSSSRGSIPSESERIISPQTPATSSRSRSSRKGNNNGPPPISEVLVDSTDEQDLDEDSFGAHHATSKRRSGEWTKIFVSPHFIPRQSAATKPISLDDTSLEERTPGLLSSSGSDSSSGYHVKNNLSTVDSSHLYYEAEESCLINDSGRDTECGTVGLMRSFETEDPDETVDVSSHEIMVVRPFAADHRADGLSEPLCNLTASWRQAGQSTAEPESPGMKVRNPDESAFNVENKKEVDDGIAPLYARRPEARVTDPSELSVTNDMIQRPEEHLLEIHALATMYVKRDRLREALNLFKTIVECQRGLHGELHEDVGGAMHNVGLAYLRLEQHQEALAMFERASRVRKGALGRDHPEVAVSLVKVGITHLLLHDFDMALVAFREALAVRKRALGALHPSTARIYNNIGCVHVEFNELREARRAFEAALDLQRNALCHEPGNGQLMFGTATTLCNLGYLYRFRGMPEKAALVLGEALELQEGVLGQSHPTVLSTKDSLAEALSLSGGCTPALKHYETILSSLDRAAPRSTSLANRQRAEAVVLYKMSKVHRQQNDFEAEVKKLQQALRQVRAIASPSPPDRRKKEILEGNIINDIAVARKNLEQLRLDWV
eukprot:CAMPEP_0194050194 /NCGR_PEP_ID=MMETSP0009_2-20130614/33830_1 /TAXON_ID=210454 /ORGANISM="Grammatophora oceanica, Strain CCMP 410" /LENGTH=1390 /DNA_ID=CAMNT_0038696681 /DNA_START=190 /DNA_END=4362 /DNA_ORIENTATION=+